MTPLLNSAGVQLYCIRRIADSVVINPRAAGPIVGLDSDYEALAIMTDAVPNYDPRLFEMTTDESKAGTEWHINYGTVPRPTVEAIINASNTESVENSRHYAERERDKLMILGLGVLFRQVANQQLTAREIALKDKLIATATRIWRNDQRLREIITALNAGQTPDLDAGWEPAP